MSYGRQLSLWPEIVEDEPGSARIRLVGRRKGFVPSNHETYRSVPLVLASGSRSKVDILRQLGLRFLVDPADIDEGSFIRDTPESLVCDLAESKAKAALPRHPGALIIGADTVVIDANGIIGKPTDKINARQILKRLAGVSHKVITGLVVIDGLSDSIVRKVATSVVKFRELSDLTIERYVYTGEPVGKAGGYGLQGIGALLIEKIEGEYTNVMGLPVQTLVDALHHLGYELI